MRKIFLLFFILFVSITSTFASNDIKIISREEWWADENYRYLDSPEWVKILKDWEIAAQKAKNTVYTKEQIEASRKKQEKTKQINEILINEFWTQQEIQSKISTENWRTLAWPIEKSEKIDWIIIHHTASDYTDSYKAVKEIYKYHALSNQRWDIWYNFLIWKNWEIFEWRAWWDYVVWAQAMRNNRSNLWIAIIWDYTNQTLNANQYNALKNLTKYLIDKYSIDLTKKTYFHKECVWNNCEKPLISELKDPIVGHRDAWNTSCPWNELYTQLETLKSDLFKEPVYIASNNTPKTSIGLAKLSDEKLIEILAQIENDLEKKSDPAKLKAKGLIIDYFKQKNKEKLTISKNTQQEIKIKLSYPGKDKIDIKSWDITLNITRSGNDIYVKWKKFNILKIPKLDKNSILEITSWSRIPAWDKEKKYNDNKFRWDLTVYVKDWKLVVVNTLKIEDYLKWLWEVSNTENVEKIKTIIISARTYATRYATMDRKFPWEFYDWVDDPDVFQKYLWYGLESRSSNINKIVDETKWIIITYNWKLIKPWYFSSSNWKTMSYYDYCKINNSTDFCSSEAKKYPFLKSVEDKGSVWKVKAWHWVWISWAWVTYYAAKWWSYDMIIKYFLRGVNV